MIPTKKEYTKPSLTTYGSVEQVTGATFKIGGGDLWTEILHDINPSIPATECHPDVPAWMCLS